MDYVEWCDVLADALADYADQTHGRIVNVQQFAGHVLERLGLPSSGDAWTAAVMDTHRLLHIYGFVDYSDRFVTLKHMDGAFLRNRYDRWRGAASVKLSDQDLILLDTTNRLSQVTHNGYTTLREVDIETILAEVARGDDGFQFEAGFAEELLDNLVNQNLLRSNKTLDSAAYESTYLGVARSERAYVAHDHEIDNLRAQGEGDTLDYKRHNPLRSKKDKRDFAKDIVSLANAGGSGPRYLLFGVDDDGQFYRPASQSDADTHRALLESLRESNLQQILTSRTTHSPSIRIAARGNHRDGPYVLLEISRYIAHLPYRVYDDQTERTSVDADKYGEVWLRKGATNAPATPVEIAALEKQAAHYTRSRSAPS